MKKAAMLLWSLIATSAILVSACATTEPSGNLSVSVGVTDPDGSSANADVNLTI
jgi:hypothetical protein